MPIVGHGDIASVLTDRPDRLYFVSGVSNSRELRESEYQREKDLLLAQDRSQHLVYVSSLCIFYAETRYARHKLEMEGLIRDNFPKHTIMRLGNIAWGENPHTLINFMRNRRKEGEPLEVQDTFRFVVEKNEFLYWVALIPDFTCEMNVPGQMLRVSEIVEKYVDAK